MLDLGILFAQSLVGDVPPFLCPDKTLLLALQTWLLNESDVTDYLAPQEIWRPLGKLGIPRKTFGVPLEYVMVIAREPEIYGSKLTKAEGKARRCHGNQYYNYYISHLIG